MNPTTLDDLIAEQEAQTAAAELAGETLTEEQHLRRIIREEIAAAASSAEERVWGDCCGCAGSALSALESAAKA